MRDKNKIYLGTTAYDEKIYLTKHKWECGWYWAFGYLGNSNCHYHFRTYLAKADHDIAKVFTKTNLSQENWWTLLELFETAYTLRSYADTMHRGGSHITVNNAISKNTDRAATVNAELAELLDYIWDFAQLAASGGVKGHNYPVTTQKEQAMQAMQDVRSSSSTL